MRVIARAYRGRPLDRFAVATVDDSHVAVSVSDKADEHSVGFPLRSVFAFDASIMKSLQAAWNAGDQKALDSWWAKARPIKASNA